jgi:hypothetical protein
MNLNQTLSGLQLHHFKILRALKINQQHVFFSFKSNKMKKFSKTVS